MFLSEPAETPFDLRFWLFGVHVRVHPFFWLAGVILGWSIVEAFDETKTGLIYLAVWVACVFASILLHEFGHVWMGRLFGTHGHIVLHGFGGLAIGSNALDRGWQRFLVSFAGPLIQLALLVVLVLVGVSFGLLSPSPERWLFQPLDPQDPVRTTLSFLIEINLLWPILNLFPIWPLDGGQMSREVCQAASPRNGAFASLVISACVAGLLALQCFAPDLLAKYVPLLHYFGDLYMAIFFAYLCVESIMALSALNAARQRRYSDDDFPWER